MKQFRSWRIMRLGPGKYVLEEKVGSRWDQNVVGAIEFNGRSWDVLVVHNRVGYEDIDVQPTKRAAVDRLVEHLGLRWVQKVSSP